MSIAALLDKQEYGNLENSDAEEQENVPIKADRQWTESQWGAKILEQESVIIAIQELATTVKLFEKRASNAELQEVQATRRQFEETMRTAQTHLPGTERTNKPTTSLSFREHFGRASKTTASTVYLYSQHLDLLAQSSPEFVGLAWGAIKILLVAQVNHNKLKESVQDHLGQIAQNFRLIETFSVYVPSTEMCKALANCYTAFARFLEKAIKYYSENKFMTAVNAFARPWETRFQPSVDRITKCVMHVKDISQVFSTGALSKILTIVERLDLLVQGSYVQLGTAQENIQLEHVAAQKLQERLDSPMFDDKSVTTEIYDRIQADTHGGLHDNQYHNVEDSDPTEFIIDLFPNLRELDEFIAAEKAATEAQPELREHQRSESNLLRLEKVMDWLESRKSQLLWVDGNTDSIASQWNSSIVVPLLRDAVNHSESALILRYFCGDFGPSNASNTARTLVQALIVQVMKQFRHYFKQSSAKYSRARLANAVGSFSDLWLIFVECLNETLANTTVLVIDSIDCLQCDTNTVSHHAGDLELLLGGLNELANSNSIKRVKVLITTRLAKPTRRSDSSSATAITLMMAHTELSCRLKEEEQILFSNKLIEIDEGRCKMMYFFQLVLLYRLGTTVFIEIGQEMRAFVVSKLSGGTNISPGRFEPLVLDCWYIEHDGSSFVKSMKKFEIPYFIGTHDVATLHLVPSGYLLDEAQHRQALIHRGQRYWNLCHGVHHQEYNGTQRSSVKIRDGTRMIIDQTLAYDIDAGLTSRHGSDGREPVQSKGLPKPLSLLVCTSEIMAYSLNNHTWITVPVDSLGQPKFDHTTFMELIVARSIRQMCLGVVLANNKARQIGRANPERLLILLHGLPGVGKSTFVESLAQYQERPLLRFRLADVTIDTLAARVQLKRGLRCAAAWKAIVLMEDAEILFAKNQQNTDGTINSLAGLFMNELETHPSIVFLVTNRIGSIDETWHQYFQVIQAFEMFSDEDRNNLWLLFFNRAKRNGDLEDVSKFLVCVHSFEERVRKFRREKFIYDAVGFNARQIANCISMALARSKSEGQPFMRVEDLALFLESQQDHTAYMHKVTRPDLY